MNHCLLEVEVLEAPQIRYTQDSQTPIAEMAVRLDGLRPDDPPGQLKVVGWGNLAQDLQNRVQVGQRLVLEGRLRINTVSRPDGVKEKRAEFTLSRLHPIGPGGNSPGGPGLGGAGMAPAAGPGMAGGQRPVAAAPQRRPAGEPEARNPTAAAPSTPNAPPSYHNHTPAL